MHRGNDPDYSKQLLEGINRENLRQQDQKGMET
jgi:hypothetical protein